MRIESIDHLVLTVRDIAASSDFYARVLGTTPIAAVVVDLQAAGVSVIEGPVQRIGARGPILSVYFRDPDSNLIEVSNPVQT